MQCAYVHLFGHPQSTKDPHHPLHRIMRSLNVIENAVKICLKMCVTSCLSERSANCLSRAVVLKAVNKNKQRNKV